MTDPPQRGRKGITAGGWRRLGIVQKKRQFFSSGRRKNARWILISDIPAIMRMDIDHGILYIQGKPHTVEVGTMIGSPIAAGASSAVVAVAAALLARLRSLYWRRGRSARAQRLPSPPKPTGRCGILPGTLP